VRRLDQVGLFVGRDVLETLDQTILSLDQRPERPVLRLDVQPLVADAVGGRAELSPLVRVQLPDHTG
jgi:hypothetical protein